MIPMKVIIMCGGKGTRLREETAVKPKPMVEIGGRPILWHIMKIYDRFGYKDFVLPLGYKGEVIKQYFHDYYIQHTDYTVDLKSGDITSHPGEIEDWRVTLCDTGQETLKGGRLKRVAKYIDTDRFMVTYGDGVSDIDIDKLVQFHIDSGKIGTFTGVRMPCRFGAVRTDNNGQILSWEEKPVLNEYINCGFFVFKREFLDYLSEDESCDLEKEPLQRLAADGQLSMYPHPGQWQERRQGLLGIERREHVPQYVSGTPRLCDGAYRIQGILDLRLADQPRRRGNGLFLRYPDAAFSYRGYAPW